MSAVEAFRGAFDALSASLTESAATRAARAAAFASFADTGLPGRRDEEWRYTPTRAFGASAWEAARPAPAPAALSPRWSTPGAVARLVFVDGVFDAAASSVGAADGLQVRRLADVRDELDATLLSGDATRPRSGFDALHEAFVTDGVVVDVAAGCELAGPIDVVHIGARSRAVAALRHVIRVGANARATVVEHAVGASNDVDGLHLDGITAIVGDGGGLDHVRALTESRAALRVGTQDVRTGRDATYRGFALSLGGRIARDTLTVRVEGSGAHTDIAALYAPQAGQHVDHHTCVDHLAPATTADQLYKGIVDDDGVAVFNGKIFVRSAAQQTAAEQLNQNLMLSKHARVDTKPQLEIFADDVRCTHGATVGKLDPDELFYLMSRAISPATARAMLIQAFAGGALDRVRHPAVAAKLRSLLDPHLSR